MLLKRASVSEDGRMVLPDGMSYRILVLPQTDRMRPELLEKIRELVLGGVTLIGPKPVKSPSLQGGQQKADIQERLFTFCRNGVLYQQPLYTS